MMMEWVNCKDKMPEPGKYVVCWAKRNPFSGYMPMVAKVVANGWVNPITEQFILEVECWTELELPKED